MERMRHFPPAGDLDDKLRGACFTPMDVTFARLAGITVEFVTECGPNCWYWKMPDGSRHYHFNLVTYHLMGIANRRKQLHKRVRGNYVLRFEGGAGPCPKCGNPHTNGGRVAQP